MSLGGFLGASGGNGCRYGTMSPPIPRPMFNSSALKPKMEGNGEIGMLGDGFDRGLMERVREDVLESRSGTGSDNNFEGGSGDEQDTPSGGQRQPKRKKYHRHTPHQIQELESYFQVVQHPDEKQRLELGRRLSLNGKQVKFWFQNRRTQMKTQAERTENSYLKRQNEELLIENIRMKEAIRNPMCNHCGSPAILGDVSIEEHNLRVENARLKEELNRISVLANKFLGRPMPALAGTYPPQMSNSGLELAVGRNSYGGLNNGDGYPSGFDLKEGQMNGMSMVPMMPGTPTLGMARADMPVEKNAFQELGMHAMDELLKLARYDDLWVPSVEGGKEVLNEEAYMRISPCLGLKLNGFVTEATRATAMVLTNTLALVDSFMDANQWIETFPCMIGGASIIDVVGNGTSGSRHCAMHLMQAEFQTLSPFVPVRHVKFLRYCKQLDEGLWAVVDVSAADAADICRRLPSGCIMQDMHNGYTKVTWVEHAEYDESVVHLIYRPLINSGLAFGAPRWLATLQRQCEYLAVLMSSSNAAEDHSGVTATGRRSMVKLSQRMIRDFCAVVCGTLYRWQPVPVGNVNDGTRLMIRSIGMDNPADPTVLVLGATTSIWMPISPQQLFDFLRDEQMRSEWDELSHTGPMQELVHIAKGQDRANYVSLLRATAANTDQTTRLILQETQTDPSGSLIVYTPVDISSMQAVTNGGDSSSVSVLASGFAIAPDGFIPDSATNSNGSLGKGVGSGSLMTVGLQMLIDNPHSGKLTMESVDSITSVIGRTVQRIKAALHCN